MASGGRAAASASCAGDAGRRRAGVAGVPSLAHV